MDFISLSVYLQRFEQVSSQGFVRLKRNLCLLIGDERFNFSVDDFEHLGKHSLELSHGRALRGPLLRLFSTQECFPLSSPLRDGNRGVII